SSVMSWSIHLSRLVSSASSSRSTPSRPLSANELLTQRDGVGPIACPEHPEQGGEVYFHRAFGDLELLRDLLVGLSRDQALEDLELAGGQGLCRGGNLAR